MELHLSTLYNQGSIFKETQSVQNKFEELYNITYNELLMWKFKLDYLPIPW